MKRLVFSNAAIADIHAIAAYTVENWGIDQSDRYIRNIRDACQNLASGVWQGRKVDLLPRYLKYLVGSHMIYLRDEGQRMKVVRILHGSMDAPKHLK